MTGKCCFRLTASRLRFRTGRLSFRAETAEQTLTDRLYQPSAVGAGDATAHGAQPVRSTRHEAQISKVRRHGR